MNLQFIAGLSHMCASESLIETFKMYVQHWGKEGWCVWLGQARRTALIFPPPLMFKRFPSGPTLALTTTVNYTQPPVMIIPSICPLESLTTQTKYLNVLRTLWLTTVFSKGFWTSYQSRLVDPSCNFILFQAKIMFSIC